MASTQSIRHAARILSAGGVIAYPTEGVFGLGCLPGDESAVLRILQIKQRDPSLGLILIISNTEQLAGWVGLPVTDTTLQSTGNRPVTWIVPATAAAPGWVCGDRSGLAVRLTTHPVASALCTECGSALISTSANISGHDPARNSMVLRRQFGALVDYIVPGDCGPARGPSEIRDLVSGEIVRPA
jgi:L-threonylcarbamoyladenylate synthase